MYEQAQNTRSAGSPKVAEQPILVEAAERLRKRLNSGFEGAARIENVLNRILNPEPQGIDKAQPAPPTNTIEGTLNDLDQMAGSLADRLHSLASKLERAA